MTVLSKDFDWIELELIVLLVYDGIPVGKPFNLSVIFFIFLRQRTPQPKRGCGVAKRSIYKILDLFLKLGVDIVDSQLVRPI